MTVTVWTREMENALRSLFDENLTAVQIADALNNEFGQSFTRSAIIGKCHRLNFPLRKEPPKRVGAAAKPVRQELRTVPRTVATGEKRFGLPFQPPRLVEVEPRNVGLLDLVTGDCRYPYGDTPDITFCGHPSIAGHVYCRPHFELTHDRTREFTRENLPQLRRAFKAELVRESA